jgi:predicted  nucleic acid-binding Zn-ribbon protein
MAEEKPRWLQTILRLERAIGEKVESTVRSDAYFDTVTQVNRARTRLTGLTEKMSREWLHLWNMPAHTDVRSLNEQLARMERRIAEIRKELADLEEDGKKPRQTPTKRRAPAKPRQRAAKPPEPPSE